MEETVHQMAYSTAQDLFFFYFEISAMLKIFGIRYVPEVHIKENTVCMPYFDLPLYLFVCFSACLFVQKIFFLQLLLA